MTISINTLPKVLFKPREAFESIKETTTLKDGILLAFIFAVIGLVITYVSHGSTYLISFRYN